MMLPHSTNKKILALKTLILKSDLYNIKPSVLTESCTLCLGNELRKSTLIHVQPLCKEHDRLSSKILKTHGASSSSLASFLDSFKVSSSQSPC